MEKNPRRGIIACVIATAIGMLVFLGFGQGAYLTCSVEQNPGADCYLRKRTLLQQKEEKFSRSSITAVELSISTAKTQRSKTTKDFWTIRLSNGEALDVTLRGVAWPKGNLDFKSLNALLVDKTPAAAHELKLVAYGIEAWFLGLVPALIGWVLLLVSWAKPVTNVTAEELSRARRSNLVLLVTATAIQLGIWIFFFRFFEKFLAA